MSCVKRTYPLREISSAEPVLLDAIRLGAGVACVCRAVLCKMLIPTLQLFMTMQSAIGGQMKPARKASKQNATAIRQRERGWKRSVSLP